MHAICVRSAPFLPQAKSHTRHCVDPNQRADMPSRSWVLLLLVLPSVCAQMNMGPEEEEMLEQMGIKGQPMGRKNLKPQAEIFKKDLKYIHCNVCRQMVEISLGKATELLEKRFKFQKKRKHDSTEFDGEGAVQEYMDLLWCAASRPAPAPVPAPAWITRPACP